MEWSAGQPPELPLSRWHEFKKVQGILTASIPIDRRDSVYARFLAEKGEGVHHVGVAAPSFDETVAAQAERGNGVLLGGEYNGIEFAYLATERDLGVVTEIFSGQPGENQQPDATYPED